MNEVWPVVSATGHRPQHIAPHLRDWVRGELERVAVKLRDEYGTTTAISGMALGVDTWWAHAALDAGLALWAYVPFPQQPDRWHADDRHEWRHLLNRAGRVRYFGEAYSVRLLHKRNDGMLDDSVAVVAVWRPSKTDGGTASAVAKARRRGMPVVHIDPDRQRTSLWAPTGKLT